MDAFQQFDNTAGFFVGNEVLTVPSDSPAAPYVKAAARDMKAYRNQKGYPRSLSVTLPLISPPFAQISRTTLPAVRTNPQPLISSH